MLRFGNIASFVLHLYSKRKLIEMDRKVTDRRLKYGEETISIPFRCPVSRVDEFRSKVYGILDSWIVSNREFTTESVVVVSETEIPSRLVKVDSEIVIEAIGYVYTATIPLGAKMVDVIGHKVHKHYSEDIYYIRHPEKKGDNVVILNGEKEVKAFIRTELIK